MNVYFDFFLSGMVAGVTLSLAVFFIAGLRPRRLWLKQGEVEYWTPPFGLSRIVRRRNDEN